MRYLKSSKLNEVREPDEVVDADFVARFVGRETLDWFRNLGGSETVKRYRDGRIFVTSTSPDGDEQRLTLFTPLPEERDPDGSA